MESSEAGMGAACGRADGSYSTAGGNSAADSRQVQQSAFSPETASWGGDRKLRHSGIIGWRGSGRVRSAAMISRVTAAVERRERTRGEAGLLIVDITDRGLR